MVTDVATAFLRLSCFESAALYGMTRLDAVRCMMAAYEELIGQPLPKEVDNVDYLATIDERVLVSYPDESMLAFIIQVTEKVCLLIGHDADGDSMAICIFREGFVFPDEYDFAREIVQKAVEAIDREVTLNTVKPF